ncbi:hypothetical protein BSZ35_07915 [Salinibacter sp. 10B]|uniref:YgaP family membrane protein n=1 Tax=Salinibacter sp. 10B TaxID=1923971 RepID=UPI000CF468FE|nr:DUF2892 domain-containing protein [Salinibacter sp. 10B]PQJ34532.1 hypothetical protein BSZ35_07915 [Salinibacter sp. 10B]
MTQNMGTIDRSLRAVIALAVGALYVTGQIGGLTAAVLGVFAAVFLGTSVVGTCPLYRPFGLSTCRTSTS